MKRRLFILFVSILLSPAIALTVEPNAEEKLAADLKVDVTGPLLEDFPVQLELLITNTGKPLYFWCGGPGKYPNASNYYAEVTDRQGRTRSLQLSNGQNFLGSGTGIEIDTTQTLPAACEPLKAGTYTLKVFCRSWKIGEERSEIWPAMECCQSP